MTSINEQFAAIREQLDLEPRRPARDIAAGAWAEAAGRRRTAGLMLLGLAEALQGDFQEEQRRSEQYAANLAALLTTIDPAYTVDQSYAHVGRDVPALRCPACVNDPSINDGVTICPGGGS